MDELLVVIKGLSQNISLFLSLAFIYYLLTSTVKISSKVLRDFLIGFVFSMIAGLGMVLRIQVAPGLYIDGRLLLVGISGAFNGPVSGITTTFFVLIFRVLLGGNGVLVGSFGIIEAGLIGLIF